ncbi:MAG: hypothetical protein KAG64_06620 [Bacteroidales bacterium]|nr:hypothetical protein [Bacteroidales bacterium]
MRNLVLFLVSVFLLSACTNVDIAPAKLVNEDSLNKWNEKSKVGIYEQFVIKSFNIGVIISMKPDFSFVNTNYSYGCTGGFRVKVVTGNYEMIGNSIHFIPKKMIWKEDSEAHEWDTKLKFDTLDYYISDSTQIQTDYRLIYLDSIKILISNSKYDERDELFYESSNFISLANAYNSGLKINITEYLLCNTDTAVKISDYIFHNQIPKENFHFFQKNPISGTVFSVHISKEFIPSYKIMKDGNCLQPFLGMKFYSKKLQHQAMEVYFVDSNYYMIYGQSIYYENTKLSIGDSISSKVN